VRIISGKYRGKKIHPPANLRARPTTDFAKEGLFNILNNLLDLEETDVLDLFSGTGSMSYEFASRGARSVVAVEKDPKHCDFIRQTFSEMDEELASVIRGDVFRYLHKPYQAFDLIFADPPYDHSLLETLPERVLETNILNKNGLFILEHPGKLSFSAHPRFSQHRKYGGVNFSFFQ